jgi:hypothetical protein
MKDTFELDVLSDLSQGTTRSNSCIDMVFGRKVDNLSCITFVSYFFFFNLDYGHCGHSWPIVPASGDNEDDCGEHDGM